MKILFTVFLSIVMLAPIAAWSQTPIPEEPETEPRGIVKWVDKDGKVHFSDRAPADLEVKAEIIETPEPPPLGLSPEELDEQKRRVENYKRETEKKQKAARKEKPAAPAATSSSKLTDEEKEEMRRICRDTHRTRVKDRVECFRAIPD